jgi:hypothetical protein
MVLLPGDIDTDNNRAFFRFQLSRLVEIVLARVPKLLCWVGETAFDLAIGEGSEAIEKIGRPEDSDRCLDLP